MIPAYTSHWPMAIFMQSEYYYCETLERIVFESTLHASKSQNAKVYQKLQSEKQLELVVEEGAGSIGARVSPT